MGRRRETPEALSSLMGEKLSVTGKGLNTRAKRAGRQLPKRVHRDVATIAEAEAMMTHPKLSKRVDPAQLGRAQRRIHQHLVGIDPSDRRVRRIYDILATISFNLILFAALLIWFLVSQGWL